MKMLLFTQRRASVLWLCKCSSDKHDNINVNNVMVGHSQLVNEILL